ncbi:hypothetical protein BOX15_Mlig023443g2 [Macrostomum lignano]|uniref:Ubiquitin-like domain-containing protein n=1 Tax=Macrostomum lignano TaxID=282301 RepID=A0A267H5J4_9PLAT|nr:hypothetical protein BOX15_Mlig023443g2 [Macrostomum lignano]
MDQPDNEETQFQKNLLRHRYSMSFSLNLLSTDITIRELKLMVLEKLQIPLRDQLIYRCTSNVITDGGSSADQTQFSRPDDSVSLRYLGLASGDHLHLVALNRGTRYLLILHFCQEFRFAERRRRNWNQRMVPSNDVEIGGGPSDAQLQ